ncbi:MAG TPA: L-threonylcarbamoyladenylate synthase, partial [Pirellulaceae bacterium]|nr:L-threonylcarbamoyladenylate synthase [Pirellulaceae bacterium]
MQHDADAMRRAVEALRRGEAIGLPTETVYGLAANAWDEAACRRIFAIKGRPATNPLIVHVADRSRLDEGAEIPSSGPVRERLDEVADLWPGPLTLILPKGQHIPSIVTAGRPTVAIRIPAHPIALELLACLP